MQLDVAERDNLCSSRVALKLEVGVLSTCYQSRYNYSCKLMTSVNIDPILRDFMIRNIKVRNNTDASQVVCVEKSRCGCGGCNNESIKMQILKKSHQLSLKMEAKMARWQTLGQSESYLWGCGWGQWFASELTLLLCKQCPGSGLSLWFFVLWLVLPSMKLPPYE